ncbi:MAG: glycosyltransferase [Candidatus Saccharicenans sp.]
MKNKHSIDKPRFLVLLFGSLSYDGRVRRMLDVYKEIGDVSIVDVNEEGLQSNAREKGVNRVTIIFPKAVGKFAKHIIFGWKTMMMAWKIKPSIIVVEDYFPLLIGLILAKLYGAKLIYDAHELIIRDPGQSMSARDLFWYLVERTSIHHADLVIAVNEERAQIMAEHYCLRDKPVVVRNLPKNETIRIEKEKILERFPEMVRRDSDEVIIIYQGDISISRGIDRFILALNYLDSRYRMIIIGSGKDVKAIKETVKTFSEQGRFSVLGPVENWLLPSITCLADLGIVTYPFRGLNNIYCAPNKIFEYLQSGLVVVCTDQPPLRRLVTQYRIGELITQGDSPKQIAKVIEKVIENKANYVQNIGHFVKDHRWVDEAMKLRKAINDI